MTKWTAPDIASIRGDNSRPLQKIFGSLSEHLKDYQNGYTLDGLDDVVITSPTAGQTLSYDAVNSLWKNATFSDGGGLTNLNASNLASGTVPTGRMTGAYTGITSVGTLGSLTVTGDLTVDTTTLTVDSTNNRVGIGTLSPSTALQVAGTVTATAFAGPLTGNVTGNVSGSAATVTGASQTAITSIGTLTTLLTGQTCSTATVAAANDTGSFSVRGNASFPAVMSFHRTGTYAVNFGLSTANKMELGGWSASTIKFTWDMATGNYDAVGTVSAANLTTAGNVTLSASTNAVISTANTPDSALPWCRGPVLQGQTGWAFYSAISASYRMGFRSNSTGTTKYFWTADSALIGQAPADSEVTNTLNVMGTGRFTSTVTAPTFSGALSGNASTATKAGSLGASGLSGTAMTFHWSGQGGQPNWLWGGSDGSNMYVYNPSNFNVNSATTATNQSGGTVSATYLTVTGGEWLRTSSGGGWYNSTYAAGIYSKATREVWTYNASRFIASNNSVGANYGAQQLEVRSNDLNSGGSVAGISFHVYGANAPVLRYWTGTGAGLDVGNEGGTGYWYMGANNFVTRSSMRWKTDIRRRPQEQIVEVGLRLLEGETAIWDSKDIEPIFDEENECYVQPCAEQRELVKDDWVQRRHFNKRGYIVEELEKVFPEAVHYESDGKPSGVDYGVITTELVDILKLVVLQNDDQQRRIELLEKKRK